MAFGSSEDACANGRASKRPASESPGMQSSSKGTVSSFIGNIIHQAYQAFFPTDWTIPPPSEQTTSSPRWQYQHADADALSYYLTRRGSTADVSSTPSQPQASPGPSHIASQLPGSLSPTWEGQSLVVHAPRAMAPGCSSSEVVAQLELAVQSPGWMCDLKQPLQIVSFPSSTQPDATPALNLFDHFNETLWSLAASGQPLSPTFGSGPVHPNGTPSLPASD